MANKRQNKKTSRILLELQTGKDGEDIALAGRQSAVV